MPKSIRGRAVLLLTLIGTMALGGCVIAPYPRYAYGPVYHPHYWYHY